MPAVRGLIRLFPDQERQTGGKVWLFVHQERQFGGLVCLLAHQERQSGDQMVTALWRKTVWWLNIAITSSAGDV